MRNKLITIALTLIISLFSEVFVFAYDSKIVISPSPLTVNPRYFYYTVNSGDSLWRVSALFGTSIARIMELNNKTSYTLYIGEKLKIEGSAIPNVNYSVKSGDNLWSLANKFNTTQAAIKTSNYLNSDNLMPGQILTIPINSPYSVKPYGINIYHKAASAKYGDIYTWENGRRLFTVDSYGILKDFSTGTSFNVKYYGGSNHADIVPITKADTDNIKKLFPVWTWNNRPMILTIKTGGLSYNLAVSMAGMPHSTTNIYDNGVSGHFDLYFLNSTSHNTNLISESHQNNVLTAGGLK
ncbi:MAG: LysM peptidoglycan-binding domain-containing protein [Bacillota bacterium]|nr:LysM peptidoglycan-binding domain-containing protein [Bacillota bacterium]